MRYRKRISLRLTLVEVDGHVPRLRKGKHADKVGILLLQLLAHRGELFLGEEPVPPLRRLPVVGGHGRGARSREGA